MNDIHGPCAHERRSHARRPAYVLTVHEDPNVAAEPAGLVAELEPEPRVAPFERVEKVLDRIRPDLLGPPRSEFPEPSIQMDVEHGYE